MIQQIADLLVKKPPHLFSSAQTLCSAPPTVPGEELSTFDLNQQLVNHITELITLPLYFVIKNQQINHKSSNMIIPIIRSLLRQPQNSTKCIHRVGWRLGDCCQKQLNLFVNGKIFLNQNLYLINKTLHHTLETLDSGGLMKFPKTDERNSRQFRKRYLVAPLNKVHRKQFNGR